MTVWFSHTIRLGPGTCPFTPMKGLKVDASNVCVVVHTCYVNSLSSIWIDEVSGEGVKQFYLQGEDAYISILSAFTRQCRVIAWDCVHIQGGYINLRRNTHDWEEEGEDEDDRSHGLLLNSCG